MNIHFPLSFFSRPELDEVTDDSALLEALGHPVVVFPGEYENLKITTADDLTLAEALIRLRPRPAWAGQG